MVSACDAEMLYVFRDEVSISGDMPPSLDV
jgi:hypothetical protein